MNIDTATILQNHVNEKQQVYQAINEYTL